MIDELQGAAVQQSPTAQAEAIEQDRRGVVHALPLALLVSGAIWVSGVIIALGLLHRL